MYDVAIIGGGIVGLSTGMALYRRFPNVRLLLLEKEQQVAKHQTGHNSGVIHSGIYYKPGSYKARFAREGSRSLVEFCQEHGIEHEICGKVIVATKPGQLAGLERLYQQGIANRQDIHQIGPEQLRDIEPHVAGLAALRVPAAGIVNYRQVCEVYANLIREQQGEIVLGAKVERICEQEDETLLETTRGTFRSRFLINCAGLYCDRVAKWNGIRAQMKIIPFRGEYYELKPEKRYLVKHLIYPVPNPNFPFLGVHFTRMIGGRVEAGPNAVLGFSREGYRKTDVNLFDFAEQLAYPGLWKLAANYWKEGMHEIARSISKSVFVRSLQQLVPEIQADDLLPAPAGIRAQALAADGKLVDDFRILSGKRSIHVLNAPSPAATASIPIGQEIASRIGQI